MAQSGWWYNLRRGFGPGFNRTGHFEKWLSLIGGLTGMLGVMVISQAELGLTSSAGLVASMGASAVLLFAVPHGPLSQPWPLVGGHLVSALIGVACAKAIAHPLLAAALAVGLAIGAMNYLRCVHPPGGATALTAVAGGDVVHALGYYYVVTPVLLNALTILLVAVIFNYPFPWRRYPAAWTRRPSQPPARDSHAAPHPEPRRRAAESGAEIMRAVDSVRFEEACAELDGEVESGLAAQDLRVGGYYCNGAFGAQWQVRQILGRESTGVNAEGADERLRYRIVAGAGRRQSGTSTRAALADWARYEVVLNESSWQRVESPLPDRSSEHAA